MRRPNIVVTGGTGYIGSHTVVELLQAGFDVVIIDNLENSDACVVDRVESIAGRRPQLVVADIRDRHSVAGILKDSRAEAVIHFAGLKLVNESCALPLRYYDVNVAGTISLLEAMMEAQVTRMVFSSSTTVYGDAATVPITEESPLKPISPYGRSKLMVEDVLRDLARGHLAALRALAARDEKELTVNLGTGRGATVLELVKTFEEVTGATVPYEFAGRRQGDVVVSFADASRARSLLGWKTERNLTAMCRDAWNWQSRNPMGYRSQRTELPRL